MPKMELMSVIFLGLLLLITTTQLAISQEKTFSIYGIVNDPEGFLLPGVKVSITESGLTRIAYTDAVGKFAFSGVRADFKLITELSGFIPVYRNLIPSSENASIQITLQPAGIAETTIVTASKTETPVLKSPASVSVIDEETIQSSSAQNYADLLRNVPGVNVSQTTNRGIAMTGRAATEVAATSQLVLVDGRTAYLDFAGIVLWDFLPLQFSDIDQIEIVRGPASAVWGANAQTGVVNIITKHPREIPGTQITFTAGSFDKGEENSGSSVDLHIRYADSINDKLSYRISGGYFHSDPFERPQGIIPRDHVPGTTILTGGTPYSVAAYENLDTNQPKLDLRVDQELDSNDRITYSAGVGSTEGSLITRTGPYRLESGSLLGYGKVDYLRNDFKLSAYVNILDAEATNLFGARGADGNLISYIFDSKSFHVEASDSVLIGKRNLLSFGANFRHSNFNITIAPNAEDRNDWGGYLQDELDLQKFLFVIGGRIDKFTSVDDPVFSPRLSVLYELFPQHSLRFSYNRAFRIPSVQDNYTDLTLLNSIRLPVVDPFFFPTRVVGNPNLKESMMDAWEAGYAGEWGENTVVTASFYVYSGRNSVALRPSVFYSESMPPPNWPLPPATVPPNTLPARFDLRNFEYTLRNKGIELSIDQTLTPRIHVYTNYSYQADPEILDAPPNTIPTSNFPPHHRINSGCHFNANRVFTGASLNYQSRAFWIDVLDARFWGPTEPFLSVNTWLGIRWFDRRLTTSIKINNLFNEDALQHVFGDIIRRNIAAEVQFQF